MTAQRPQIIAHRGASGYLPEHSLAAKALAHAQGADFLEQDVVLTRDHVPVVVHDIHLETTTDVALRFPGRNRSDGRFYALDLDLAELQTLTLHERTDLRTGQPVFPRRFPAGVGAGRIPTLADELEFIAGLNRTSGRQAGIYPEIKQPAWHRRAGVAITPIVAETIARHWSVERGPCYVQCFEFAELRTLKAQGWPSPLIYLVNDLIPESGEPDLQTSAGWQTVASIVQGVGPNIPLLVATRPDGGHEPSNFVSLAQAARLLLHPWTVRADALPLGFATVDSLLTFLLDQVRVDGLFIDHPNLGVAALANRRQ